MSTIKRIFIIAGPNGSGKTTTALSLLPDLINIYEFINADEIARGLAPLHPESMALTASKLMITRLRELLNANKSFAFETTAAGRNYIKYLKEAKNKRYEINLVYLWLDNEDLAIKRVAQRVAQGGHHVPAEIIRRRYKLGVMNIIKHYLSVVDSVPFLDNSIIESQKIIARKSLDDDLKIEDMKIWEKMQRLANV